MDLEYMELESESETELESESESESEYESETKLEYIVVESESENESENVNITNHNNIALVEFVLGPCRSGKTNYILNSIKKKLTNESEGLDLTPSSNVIILITTSELKERYNNTCKTTWKIFRSGVDKHLDLINSLDCIIFSIDDIKTIELFKIGKKYKTPKAVIVDNMRYFDLNSYNTNNTYIDHFNEYPVISDEVKSNKYNNFMTSLNLIKMLIGFEDTKIYIKTNIYDATLFGGPRDNIIQVFDYLYSDIKRLKQHFIAEEIYLNVSQCDNCKKSKHKILKDHPDIRIPMTTICVKNSIEDIIKDAYDPSFYTIDYKESKYKYFVICPECFSEYEKDNKLNFPLKYIC